MHGEHLLLIDDDVEFTEMIAEYLALEGFSVEACYDGETGITLATKQPYDAILLDIMLPTIDGLNVLRSLNTYIETPIILLTASGKDLNHILGLEYGAEDYIDKPCNAKILAARIRAVLKRQNKDNTKPKKSNLKLGSVEINYSSLKVLVHQKPIKLTRSEFRVFELLLAHLNQVFSKEEIAAQALDRELTKYDRSIDAHVINLRAKLRKAGLTELNLETVHGYGYKLTNEA